ncbi:MAG: hypothetical protein R6V55_04245 [Desulfovermiculus sp.]
MNSSMTWHTVQSVHTTSQDAVQARVLLPENSQWFDGHFPGEPILPGIAQLAMVEEIVRRGFGVWYRLLTVDKVRFKKVIRPGDEVSVLVCRKNHDQMFFSFQVLHQGDLACGGRAGFVRGEDVHKKI